MVKKKHRQLAENAGMFDLIMEYARQLKIYKVDQFVPPYVISLGCHILNLWNKKFNPDNYKIKWKKIYDYWFVEEMKYRQKRYGSRHYDYLWLFRSPADLRIHLFFVAPPGYGKSLMESIFMDKNTGILNILNGNRWRFIPCKQMKNLTEAALVGTAKTNSEAKVKRFYGIGEKQPHALIGVDEAANLFTTRPEAYNQGRDVQLLGILDSGLMSKATGLSEIEVQTYLSFWCASQPARFQVQSGSGLDRRFAWMLWLPKARDSRYLIKQVSETEEIKTPFELLGEIKTGLLGIYRRFTLRKLIWDGSVIKTVGRIIKKYKLMHTDITMYKKICLGYCFMKYYRIGYTKLIIKMNPELEKILENFARWKDRAFTGDLRLIHLKRLINELHGFTKTQFARSVRRLGHPAETLDSNLNKLKSSNEILVLKRLERGREVERIYSVYLTNNKIVRYLHLDKAAMTKNRLRTDKLYQHGVEKTIWTDRKTFWELYNMRNDDKRLLEDPTKSEEHGYKCWINKRYYLVKIIKSKGYIWRRYYDYMRQKQKVPDGELKITKKLSENVEKRIEARKKKVL